MQQADRPPAQHVGKDFIRNFFIPALRGGFIGLLLGLLIRALSLRFSPGSMSISGITSGIIIVIIPYLWISTIERKEVPIVPYDSENSIPSPYLTVLSMAYFMAVSDLFIR